MNTNNQNLPATFTFPVTGQTVRTVVIEGEPWFVAGDVTRVLQYKDGPDAVRRHCKYARILKAGEAPTLTTSPYGITVIRDGDVVRLITRSKLPAAQRFESWIFDEVVPAVLDNGFYVAPAAVAKHGSEAMMERVLAKLEEIEERHAQERQQMLQHLHVLGQQNVELKPKADVYDTVMAKKEESVVEFCRRLPGVNLTQVQASLMNEGYLWRKDGHYRVRYHFRDKLFAEKVCEKTGYTIIIPLDLGKQEIVKLYRDNRLTMKKGCVPQKIDKEL